MANRYFRNTGNTSWGVTSNWSATDGGGSVGFTPNNADDVFFTANSGNCVLNTVGVAKSVTLTGFTGTLTMTNALQVYGNLTFYPGTTIAGLSGIEFYGNGILTSNGVIWPNNISIWPSNISVTLADNLTILGAIISQGGSGSVSWLGSFGWTCREWIISPTSITITVNHVLAAGVTYRTGKFTSILYGGAVHGLVKSNTTGTKANLIVTGDVNVGFLDFTDIDASGGRTINTFNGVVSNCTNIISMIDKTTAAGTVADSFIL